MTPLLWNAPQLRVCALAIILVSISIFMSQPYVLSSFVGGIKHQIRVHLSAALETPILGDHKYSHFGHLAPQRLSNRTIDALGIRQSKARYIGLHLHAHRLVFQGSAEDGGNLLVSARQPPPPGFFTFIKRQECSFREARNFTAPIPGFFLANLKRLGIHMPSVLKWSRFSVF